MAGDEERHDLVANLFVADTRGIAVPLGIPDGKKQRERVGAFAAVAFIDSLGRRRLFILGLGIGALPLLYFAFGGAFSALEVLVLVCASFLFITILALSLATYTAENYPTHLRALGGGVAGAWQRGASMVGPMMVGWILPNWGLNTVFVVFGLFAAVGAIITWLFAIETRGEVLERLSPT